uniref:Uncharacterized protein n=1 Tax=Oryza sativa subsp. japonica TaxID=39947 RepID=Q6ZLJ4_ORYSJ|nr:hypothetical protein [Oryza sativa Japonica Group]BAD30813.1 hypothetical protein [Oryza sativa Japonica Group]
MMREAVSLAEQLWPYCRRPARSEATLAPCFSNIARGRTYQPAGELHATFDAVHIASCMDAKTYQMPEKKSHERWIAKPSSMGVDSTSAVSRVFLNVASYLR